MPEDIIKKFRKQYGPRGEEIFHRIAKKQQRDLHTFHKENIRDRLYVEPIIEDVPVVK